LHALALQSPPLAALRQKAGGLLWFVARTRSRHETAVARQLGLKGLSAFLPWTWGWSRRGGRRQPLPMPMFPGYVFVGIFGQTGEPDKEQYVRALRTAGLVSLLGQSPGGPPSPVSPGEVESLMVLSQSQLAAQPHEYFVKGQAVRVVSGPLAGAEGLVRRVRGHNRLVVRVLVMGRAVAVELDEAQLEPLA